jgi:hypothetical protein
MLGRDDWTEATGRYRVEAVTPELTSTGGELQAQPQSLKRCQVHLGEAA